VTDAVYEGNLRAHSSTDASDSLFDDEPVPASESTVYAGERGAGADGVLHPDEVAGSGTFTFPQFTNSMAAVGRTPTGDLTVHRYFDDLSAVGSGRGRLSVRHAAAVRRVRITLTSVRGTRTRTPGSHTATSRPWSWRWRSGLKMPSSTRQASHGRSVPATRMMVARLTASAT
jgi:hypothetical protein